MKNSRKIFLYAGSLWLFVLLLFSAVGAQDPARYKFTINDDWNFFPDETAGAEKKDLEDKNWQKISIPHTWNLADTFDDEPGYRRGASWYRRELNLSQNLKNKRIFLYFEAANQTAEVFFNEKKLGRHIGGFTAFVFDVTDFADFDRPNLIAVRVENTLEKDIPPLDQDFSIYGGIYRDVWLIAANPVHFKIDDHAAPGVKIETPQVSAKSARVKFSGTIVNESETAREIEITNTVFNSENRRVNSTSSVIKIGAQSEANFEQISKEIKNPKLWSPDEPNLYRVKSVVSEKGKILDEIENPLGFRFFKFDANEGFFLNGKPLKLKGTNRHQDFENLGIAVPDRIQVRDLEIIKENGFNFLRLAHYPQDPSVLEAADRLGLLIWEEIPIVNLITISEAFNENSKNMLREMIRQHRNHPSIILWGYMNEVFLRSPKTEADFAETVKLAKELEKICEEEDPTRATAMAFDYGEKENYYKTNLIEVADVVGWNLYFGWYYETFADLGKFLDEQHRRYPHKPLLISEYGANADQRLHSENPKRFDSTVEWQRMFHEAYLPQIMSRKFLAGAAIWNQFDFGSEFRGETIPHLNQKGMYTYGREPKDIAYFYKANYSAQPVLHIAARDWKFRSGSARHTIDVYTNFETVELFQNGKSLGVKSAVDRKISWEADLIEEKNSFTAITKDKIPQIDTAEVFFKNTRLPFYKSFREIAVNVGSNADFTDEAKTVWTTDKSFENGGWGFLGSEAKEISTLRNVFETLDDPLFQTMRENLSGFKFDVPDGFYEIEMLFVEPKFKEKGKRIFDVGINEKIVLENLDLAGEIGFQRAVSKKIRVSAENERGLEIKFFARTDKPVLSGVRIKRIL